MVLAGNQRNVTPSRELQSRMRPEPLIAMKNVADIIQKFRDEGSARKLANIATKNGIKDVRGGNAEGRKLAAMVRQILHIKKASKDLPKHETSVDDQKKHATLGPSRRLIQEEQQGARGTQVGSV